MPHTPILTIWHNNVGRPIPCVGLPKGYAGRSGISPWTADSPDTVTEFVRTVDRYGAAIMTDDRNRRPFNHGVSGVGGGHDDAEWCESRFEDGSMAAWYENEAGTWNDPAANIARRATKGDR